MNAIVTTVVGGWVAWTLATFSASLLGDLVAAIDQILRVVR